MIFAGMETVESKSGISLITKGGRQEPPAKEEREQSNTESAEKAHSNNGNKQNEVMNGNVLSNEDNNENEENEEYFEEKDLLNNAFVLEKDKKKKISEEYKEMPSRVYLEKTGVIKAITLALQSATEHRPQDAATFVADILMKYNAKCKEEERNKNQAAEENTNVCDLSQINLNNQ